MRRPGSTYFLMATLIANICGCLYFVILDELEKEDVKRKEISTQGMKQVKSQLTDARAWFMLGGWHSDHHPLKKSAQNFQNFEFFGIEQNF